MFAQPFDNGHSTGRIVLTDILSNRVGGQKLNKPQQEDVITNLGYIVILLGY